MQKNDCLSQFNTHSHIQAHGRACHITLVCLVCDTFPLHTIPIVLHVVLPVMALISVCMQVVFPAPLGPRAIMPCRTI